MDFDAVAFVYSAAENLTGFVSGGFIEHPADNTTEDEVLKNSTRRLVRTAVFRVSVEKRSRRGCAACSCASVSRSRLKRITSCLECLEGLECLEFDYNMYHGVEVLLTLA